MRITNLYLRNYRVYEDALDLELPGGLVGIYGPNGGGKTALMESILFALFGRSRTAKEHVRTAGVKGDCVVEVAFEHEGHLYTVRRSIVGAANTVKAQVMCDGSQWCEGVRDTARMVHSILGMDDAAFRASVFAEQKQLATFHEKRPEERRKLVLQLLGITPLDDARTQARADAKVKREQVEHLRSVLPDIEALRAAAEQAAAAGEVAEHEAAAEEAAAATARQRAHDAEAAAAALEAVEREYDALVIEGKGARTEADRAAERVAELTAELEALTGAADELGRLEPDADGLRAVEARLAAVDAVTRADAALTAVPAPPAMPEPDEADAEELRAAADAAAAAVAELDGALRAACGEVERARQALDRTDGLTGEAHCPACGQELGDSFETVVAHRRAELADANARVEQLEAERTHRRSAAEQALAAAKAGADRLRAAQQAFAAYERARADRRRLEEAAAEARSLLGDAPPEPGEGDRLAADVERRRQAARRCDQLRGRLERRPQVEQQLEQARERHALATERRRVLLEKVDALGFDRPALEAARRARDDARAAAERVAGVAQQARLAAERAKSEAARQQALLDQAEEQHRSIAELTDDARHLGRVSDLLTSFRTEVISTVSPRLAAQAAELFAELTDREYDLLEVNGDDYALKIRDAGISYELSRFSGSEVDLANLALRIAISEQVRFQSGGAVGLLVLDEVFGPLDEDRKERMLLALERLRARFRQILVVTHDAEIKEQLPSAIQVLKLPGRRATARVISGT